MNIPLLFKQYGWLVETIYHARRITLSEINRKWVSSSLSDGVELARTTFYRYKEAIQDIFGIIIECDRKGGYKYYIENPEVLEGDSVQNWMLSTLSISNLLGDNLSMQDRILLESIPSGDEKLQEVIKAMREGRHLLITYRRYDAPSSNTFSAEPYCVKLFKRRWYVLTKLERHFHKEDDDADDSYMAVFSLDRIEQIVIQDTRFKLAPSFDAATYFNECFGIVVGDGSVPCRIVLRAYGMEPHFMKDLPLHHSQRVVNQTEEYTDFELFMRPTSDFLAHVLSRGEWLQVLSPKSLVSEIKEWLRLALARYE